MIETQEFLTSKNAWVEIFTALGIEQTLHLNHNPACAEHWLVICRGGNTRSVAVAMLLKYKYKKDALTASLEKNAPNTLRMLMAWADRILVMELDHYKYVREHYSNKVELLDLTRTARLRAHPFEIPFLKEIDAKLQYFVKGDGKNADAATANS